MNAIELINPQGQVITGFYTCGDGSHCDAYSEFAAIAFDSATGDAFGGSCRSSYHRDHRLRRF